MHISEGILSGEMLAAGWAGSIAGISYGLKKTDTSKIVQTALISSAFFLASLVNVRIGPSSTHLSLLAPMGLILGEAVFPAVFVALLLQAVLFQFGGLVVLGVNTFAMATSALLVYFVFGRAISKSKHVSFLAFMAGFSAVMIAAGISGAFLGLTDRNFLGAIKILAAAHVPVAIIEGIVTAFLMTWLKKSSFSFYR